MTVCLLDPGLQDHSGLPSDNLGDLIIQQAVLREVSRIFGNEEMIQLSTHAPLEAEQFELMQQCSHLIVGGSNLLSSNMDEYNQWNITLQDALRIKKVILLGVSWWQYQGRPNWYTFRLIRAALAGRGIHSVRDSFSQKRLRLMGIWNVVNTSCPTLWPLADFQPGEIPTGKAENALVMLTDYSQKPDLDRTLLELAIAHYQTVYVWPQGRGDRDYILGMNLPVTLLDRSLTALETFLNSDLSFDYIGTRLHGGIRCLLAKKRSLVLAIDHRAKEIGQETGLPTSERDDFDCIRRWIEQPSTTQIRLNLAAIDRWRGQFKMRRGAESRVLAQTY